MGPGDSAPSPRRSSARRAQPWAWFPTRPTAPTLPRAIRSGPFGGRTASHCGGFGPQRRDPDRGDPRAGARPDAGQEPAEATLAEPGAQAGGDGNGAVRVPLDPRGPLDQRASSLLVWALLGREPACGPRLGWGGMNPTGRGGGVGAGGLRRTGPTPAERHVTSGSGCEDRSRDLSTATFVTRLSLITIKACPGQAQTSALHNCDFILLFHKTQSLAPY